VAVLGRGRGGLGPSLFVQAPQFFHHLLIIALTRRSRARPAAPRVFWVEPPLQLAKNSTVEHRWKI